MRLLEISLEGIRSYHERQVIPLAGVRCASVVGKNGAGKSTILTGVLYALYGLSRGADELLSHDAQRGEVVVKFEIDGKRYKVARGRERNRKPWLSLAWDASGPLEDTNWVTVPTHTIAETQRYLSEILGMTEDVFCASVFSPQGQAGALIQMTLGRRKQLLGELLGLEIYESYRDRFAGDLRTLDQRLAIAEDRIDGLRTQIEAIDQQSSIEDPVVNELEAARSEVERCQSELDAAVKREKDLERYHQRQQLTRQINSVVERGKSLKDRRTAAKERRESLPALEPLAQAVADAETARHQELEALAAQQAVEKSVRAEVQHAADAHRRAGVIRAEAERTLARVVAGAREAERAFENFEGAEHPVCDRCGQTVEGEHLAQVAEQLANDVVAATKLADDQEQAVSDARAVETELQARLDAAEQKLEEQAAPKPSPERARTLVAARDRLDGARRAIAELDAIDRQLAEEPTASQLRGHWDALRTERDRLPLEPPAGVTVAEARQELDRARDAIGEAGARRIAAQERASRRLAASEALEREEGAVGGDRRRREALSVLERAFSRNGIPAALLDGAVAGVEQAANDVLVSLGGTFSVRLDTQRELKSGGVGETLDIVVDDGLVERTLETFSGGEQYRVHMALRLGLAQALGRRSMDCVLIDEVTDLDADGVRQLAEMLTRLPGKQVLLVTHAEDLVDALPQKISVTRNGTGSASLVQLQT